MMRMMYLFFFISSLTDSDIFSFSAGIIFIYDWENGFDCFYSYNVFISTYFLYILALKRVFIIAVME